MASPTKTSDKALKAARETLKLEAEAIKELAASVDKAFEHILHLLLQSKGRLVVSGIGKSALIAQKLVATFNSTGQPALYMHAAEALHGDLGIVQKQDVVLCLSKSGDSPEIKALVPLIKSMGNVLLGMTANEKGYLAKHSDHVLRTPVKREACPHNLAPTTSTAAQMALGDALAMALMEARGFSSSDFARVHPGGALGKKLYLRMGDLLDDGRSPAVNPGASIRDVIIEISKGRLGAVAVVEDKKLRGIITDGDLRRMLQRNDKMDKLKARDIMSTTPKTMQADELAVRGFQLMEEHHITQMIVLRKGKYAGIVHLHDILQQGIF